MNLPPIGILATGTYIPTPRMSSGDISEAIPAFHVVLLKKSLAFRKAYART